MTTAALADPEVLALLRTLYRVRPETVTQLSTYEAIPRHRLDEILDLLVDAGYVQRSGEALTFNSPDAATTRILSSVIAENRAALSEATSILQHLPSLARDWELGLSGDESPLAAEVIHGHQAQWEAWARYAVEQPPQRPMCMYPDLSILESLIAPELADVRRETGVTVVVRAILPAAICADPASRRVLDLLVAGGLEIRTLPVVPSLLYVDAGLYTAVPLNWGEHPPNSLLIVRNPAVVAAIAYVMESQWARAAPWQQDDDGWQPVLRLLEQGLSDRAIADALGASVRTVQRRITEAMTYFDVSSRFELGAAWARHSVSDN
jgi:DNA-binding CsgD family transcriptional regulator